MEAKFLIFLLAIIPTLWAQVSEVGHGETCNDDEELSCISGLTCLYNTCSCLTGQGYQWDVARQRCVGRVGSTCGSTGDCIGNSSCVEMFCQCDLGYSRDRSGHCRSEHGQRCLQNVDCNQDVFLFCNGGYCRCVNDTTRLFKNGYCGSLVGEACDPNQDYFGFPNGQTGNKCLDGIECQKKETTNTCGCPSGYEVLDNKTCGAPSGSTRWEITTLCFLSCISFIVFL